ncbi:2OG-Fe(II) oxygenase superfamily [Carex littledalei]|uniref:2OG-Fe(II) oxygenase superfamily n=1 Tax=Carex littledalei TaxID=544730 RepID=A0A833RJD9_9POAL|nr:2OG-Fe(II) oxygenase superfamily [Carex littledalei]
MAKAGQPAALPDVFARDAIIAWYRGEFAAANAIIDALCGHLSEIGAGRGVEYQPLFGALHRRRLNWFPVLHLQKFYSIADVANELRRVADAHTAAEAAIAAANAYQEEVMAKEIKEAKQVIEEVPEEEVIDPLPSPVEEAATNGGSAAERDADVDDSSVGSPDRKSAEEEEVTVDGGSQGEHSVVEYQGDQSMTENFHLCTDHEDCMTRPERIKILKGFVAKESIKGHMVNVVKGLKIYEDIFLSSELLKLGECINELRQAGRRGELSGETFIFFNKQIKGNKREIIQLGVPLFQPTSEEATTNIEPIPGALQDVIDHLVLWRLIPESRKPNSCIINFFDEDESSQPYYKPPHLDNPISTLLLSETSMAFGRALFSDQNGNYKGPLSLNLKEGSLLVMRGNSADMARHVVCPSSNRRVSISFVRVRPPPSLSDISSMVSSPTKAITLWQPGTPPPQKIQNGAMISGYGPHALIPSPYGMVLRAAPLVMVAPTKPMVAGPNRRMTKGGTGVFLPWTVGPKRYNKHLPPRIQRRRFASFLPAIEAQG